MPAQVDHPYLRVARVARVSARSPEHRKPWCASSVELFVDKSGWVFCEERANLSRIVPFVLPDASGPLYGWVPMEGEQGLCRKLYSAQNMADFLNGLECVPAEVSITFREAVE